MIPTKWIGLPSYNDPVYNPVWAAAAEAGLPVHTHSGVGPDEADYGFTPGLLAIYTVESYWWAARPLWSLVLGGVFERYPALKYVIAENGAWWAPDIVIRMDRKWEGDHATRKFGPSAFRDGMTLKPSEYFHRNCYFAASVMGPDEIDRRYDIGVDNLMWGSDYPHPEGTWPHTREWLAERFGRVPQDEARRILGLTAAPLYRFDLAALAPHVERTGPTVPDIHGETTGTGADGHFEAGFRDRVVVVTGGASGIGRASASGSRPRAPAWCWPTSSATGLSRRPPSSQGRGGRGRGHRGGRYRSGLGGGARGAAYERFGAVHVLINNAGVGSPSAKPWETTPNDWRWVHSVNVFGVAHGVQAFVPRMLASGEPGHVINTASGDGVVNPLPGASVYAASKAAVATLTECLAAQLAADGAAVGVSLFLPGGGLLDTGLWTADRNRPGELARERPRTTPAITVGTLVELARARGHELRVQPLDALAEQVIAGITAGTYSSPTASRRGVARARRRSGGGRTRAGGWQSLPHPDREEDSERSSEAERHDQSGARPGAGGRRGSTGRRSPGRPRRFPCRT